MNKSDTQEGLNGDLHNLGNLGDLGISDHSWEWQWHRPEVSPLKWRRGPKLDILFVGEFDEEPSPIGAKGLGKLTAVSVAPAIVNAI
jgi:hypothetical protein